MFFPSSLSLSFLTTCSSLFFPLQKDRIDTNCIAFYLVFKLFLAFGLKVFIPSFPNSSFLLQ
ncbi:hypothetical protein BDW59DRAFT_144572 [Aspergillus cavernicola]|uniref:Uncharacterized protein n=1 Tax=Aspergillus cavernicola TaxID=176166 RepID=A0ABR4IGZ7_9EURO